MRNICRFYRKAGLIHVSLGTEAAAQLKLDRFNKETKVADNKRAIQLLRKAGIVVEAQFIVGLENETAETLEETYRMAMDWKPDLANWSMYTPWPFTSPVPGAERQGRGVRLREVQFRHADPEAGGDGARRTARSGDEQLPALLYAQGAVFVSLGGPDSGGGICSAA